jgi:5-hydroxyisourate hydrolase-like protein (transthyretin family)
MATASLSTHVLDTGAGHPAPGVTVELTYGGAVVSWAQTDGDGRAHLGDELAPGIYRLAFASPPSAFFLRVELEIELAEGHYHVPLLVSPYSCASYRGS